MSESEVAVIETEAMFHLYGVIDCVTDVGKASKYMSIFHILIIYWFSRNYLYEPTKGAHQG